MEMISKVFHTRWVEVLFMMSEMPQEHILESVYKMRIRDSEQLKTVLALYDQDMQQKDFSLKLSEKKP